MVTDDAAVEAITSGPDGILAGLEPGKVYVDMSTISPQASREVAEQVRAVGAQMLDAPVSGSIPQAQTGTLAIMVGGDPTAFGAVEPLLATLGQTVTHVGTNGQGLLLKLAINISLAVQTLAFSEGLMLAERGGIDPRLAADVMSTSSIGSPMLKARVPLLLDLPEHAWFDITMMHKDIRLALGAADEQGIAAPVDGRRGSDPHNGRRARLRASRSRLAARGARQDSRPRRLESDCTMSAIQPHITHRSSRRIPATHSDSFLLQRVQPGLSGLMDGALSTLAPIFAVVLATHRPLTAFYTGIATALGAGVSMAFSEGLSDTGEMTGRGSPVLRGAITGGGTFLGGVFHTLPFLIPAYQTAIAAAIVIVAVELLLLGWLRHRFFQTSFIRSFLSVTVGGAIIASLSAALGVIAAG